MQRAKEIIDMENMRAKTSAGNSETRFTAGVSNPSNLHAQKDVDFKNEARILDAVTDQNGRCWIRYGAARRSVWLSVEELVHSPSVVFARLARAGTRYLTPSRQNQFKREIEAHADYRDALVAERPGWVDEHYVFGDGTTQSPPDSQPIIIAFETDEKFSKRGCIGAWREEIGPLAEDQRLPIFALCYAFVGPLLRFAPAGYANPQVEIVGRCESGKSTLLVASQSVWGGNPASDVGACESWDLTVAALDDLKLKHADGFLALDEGNLAGINVQQKREVICATIFKMAGTGRKKRYRDDGPGHQAHVAMMSTTNTSLAEHAGSHGHEAGALRSRMLTIRIDDQMRYGIFSSLPKGCSTAREASERLRKAANENYGVAARKFIRELVLKVSEDEAMFRDRIEKLLKQYSDRAPQGGSARIEKTFALTAVAGFLACELGVLPFDKRRVSKSILELHESVSLSGEAQASQSGVERIRNYAKRYDSELIRKLGEPLDREAFEAACGFCRRFARSEELLIPSARFQREFPDYRALIGELAENGLARTEKGSQPKLTIKTPSSICASGRVYCIILPP